MQVYNQNLRQIA
jgi:C1A family cysteine protease